MVPDDDALRLAHQAHQFDEAIAERRALWADQGGRSLRNRHLRPLAESIAAVVALLRERDVATDELEAALGTVERYLDESDRECTAAAAELDDVDMAVTRADLEAALAAKDERDADAWARRAEQLTGLANACPGECCDEGGEVQDRERGDVLSSLERTYPTLGVRHLLEGESVGTRRFAGFHSRRSRTGLILSSGKPDADGVYSASVVGWHPNGHVVFKTVSKHTFFPDDWTEEQICEQTLNAYNKAIAAGGKSRRWRAVSSSGITIVGHRTDNGSIIGYPVEEEHP